jgi:hypothetical protein
MRLEFVGMMMGVVRGELDAWGASVHDQGASPLADQYSIDASVVQPGAHFSRARVRCTRLPNA